MAKFSLCVLVFRQTLRIYFSTQMQVLLVVKEIDTDNDYVQDEG